MRSSTLSDIADTCKKNNAVTGLQGFIVFKEGKFLQYLEGDEQRVLNLYQVISQDTRHKNIQLITQGSGTHSRFSQHNMYCFDAVQGTSGEDITDLMGEFDTYNWNEAQVEQVVKDFSAYRATHSQAYSVRVESYLLTVIKQFVRRHAVFLVVQLFFLTMFAILAVYFFG